ncbi:MAG: alpha/beta fold hydrolase [Planctomycetes bacterium]|nr:alpha/beta fold hydrolase [Planctomycetota bacterium]
MRIVAAALLALLLPLLVLAQEAPAPEMPVAEKPVAEKPVAEKPAESPKFSTVEVCIPRITGMTKEQPKKFDIAGSLRLPAGEKPAAGWPAVLFVSGSGSQTRQGIQGKLDIGTTQLLDAVAEGGFAVLAVDDRGVGQTPMGEEGKDPKTIGYLDLVGDAKACLAWLQAHEAVNRGKVFVIGHSEGGLTAPILAADDETVAGIVCMGAMGRNLYDVTLDQVEAAMKGQPAEQREGNLKAQREFMTAVKEGRDPDWNVVGAEAAPVLKAQWKQSIEPIKAWWHDHFNLDVPAIHARVKCPVFVAQGAADFQTSAERDARQIVKDVLTGPCTDVRLKIYADLDHLFKPCGGRASDIKMYFEKRDVDAAFKADVVSWLVQHR